MDREVFDQKFRTVLNEPQDVRCIQLITTPYRTYRSRWYVLFLFSTLAMVQNLVYSTISPIAPLAEPALHLTQTDIALLANWANFASVISVFPYIWLVQVKGLRVAIVSSAVFITAGAFIRCLNTGDLSENFDKVMLHLGQFINGIGGPVLWFGCTKVSSAWFPPEERTISTSIGLVSGGLGSAFSFLIGPYTVTTLATKWSGGGAPTMENIALAIRQLFYGEAVLCAILCTLTIFYFPSVPPKPPCYSAKSERFDFFRGLVQFSKSRDGWLLLILFSISGAVLSAWTQFLALTVQDVIDDIEAGWLGFVVSLLACLSGPITSLTTPWWINWRPKVVSACLSLIGAACTVVFFIAAIFVQPLLTPALCWGTLSVAAFFITASQPLWFEFGAEACYPISEEIVSGIFTLGNTAVSIIFYVLYSFPSLGTSWTNWCLAISECACVPLILFFSGNTNRLADDRRHCRDQADSSPSAVNTTNDSYSAFS